MDTLSWVECFWCPALPWALSFCGRHPVKVLLSRYYSDVVATFGNLLSLLPYRHLDSETSTSASRVLGKWFWHVYFYFLIKKRKPKTTDPHPARKDDSVGEWLPEKKPQSQEITLIEWKLRNDRQCHLSPGYKQYFHALPIILLASNSVYFY